MPFKLKQRLFFREVDFLEMRGDLTVTAMMSKNLGIFSLINKTGNHATMSTHSHRLEISLS